MAIQKKLKRSASWGKKLQSNALQALKKAVQKHKIDTKKLNTKLINTLKKYKTSQQTLKTMKSRFVKKISALEGQIKSLLSGQSLKKARAKKAKARTKAKAKPSFKRSSAKSTRSYQSKAKKFNNKVTQLPKKKVTQSRYNRRTTKSRSRRVA